MLNVADMSKDLCFIFVPHYVLKKRNDFLCKNRNMRNWQRVQSCEVFALLGKVDIKETNYFAQRCSVVY